MIDPDTIHLSRFTGPLRYRVALQVMGHVESQAWTRWLHAYVTTLGLAMTPQGRVANVSRSAGEGVPPRERRILLAWLAGQDAVEAVDVTRGMAGTGLSIEVSISGENRRSPLKAVT